ncbi:MAG: histidine phosphatase family protein [Candidatus Pacebacteria bacterium]|nr:histidine phosphatase family protein [Candidatus Paceibacterota bacterium]
MEKHIYFVRHGESEENLTRIHIGASAQLTDTGKEQSLIVAERIQRIGVEALISSPFARASDTATPIALRLGVALELNEFLGEWLEPSMLAGLHIDDPKRKSVREEIRAAVEDHEYRHADEETFSELVVRANTVIRMLEEHPASRICVVTHGGFLRIIIGAMLFGTGFTKKDFVVFLNRLQTSNTGITYVKRDETLGWRLVTWNDISHFG